MVEKTKKKGKEKKEIKMIVGTEKNVGTRGRIFQGKVIRKFDKRVVVEFERTVRIQKYERFAKKKTRLHARTPQDMKISEGDYVKVRECRPLSKIIHFVVIEIVKKAREES